MAIFRFDDETAEGGGDAVRERAHRSGRIGGVAVDEIASRDRLADHDERAPRPERPRLFVHEPDRQQGDAEDALVRMLGAQQETCGAAAKRHQERCGLAHTFREQQEGLARAEELRDAGERLGVSIGAAFALLPPMHGDGADGAQQRSQNGIAEQRRLRHRTQGAGQHAEQQHRVDERVLMVGDDEERTAARHVRTADDFDTPVEDAEEQARRCREKTGDHLGTIVSRAPEVHSRLKCFGATSSRASCRPPSSSFCPSPRSSPWSACPAIP